MKAVAYYRVSTAAQGRSGLGLEAQKASVRAIAEHRSFNILAEFTEVESGRRSDRPELTKALTHARLTGATLVIAKLDRLSRNASFLLALRDSGVRFLAADIPDANDLTIGVLAVIAQAEREAISRRTIDALNAAKNRIAETGFHTSHRTGRTISRLGNPNGSAALRRSIRSSDRSAEVVSCRAESFAEDLRTLVTSHTATAYCSDYGLSRKLNELGILSPRGQSWHPSTARLLRKRLGL